MFIEPYATTILKHSDTPELNGQLQLSYIQRHLNLVKLNGDTHHDSQDFIYEIPPGVDNIPLLVAPKLIVVHDGNKVVIDSRATKSRAKSGTGTVVTSYTDYRFNVREAALTYFWNQGAIPFSQLGELPLRVYSRWITNAFAYGLGLSGKDEMVLAIRSAYFYMCSFTDVPYTEAQMIGIASVISRALIMPIDVVLNEVNGLGLLRNVADFIECMKTSSDSTPRAEKMSAAFLYTQLKSTWYGANNSITCACAVEYPPTFLAMLYSAFEDRSFHTSYFAKMAMQADRKQMSKPLVQALRRLSRGLIND